jgi:hypothetical protein
MAELLVAQRLRRCREIRFTVPLRAVITVRNRGALGGLAQRNRHPVLMPLLVGTARRARLCPPLRRHRPEERKRMIQYPETAVHDPTGRAVLDFPHTRGVTACLGERQSIIGKRKCRAVCSGLIGTRASANTSGPDLDRDWPGETAASDLRVRTERRKLASSTGPAFEHVSRLKSGGPAA